MKKMMMAVVCLMAAMAFAAVDGVCPTKVLKASDFKEMEKIDLTDITKFPPAHPRRWPLRRAG